MSDLEKGSDHELLDASRMSRGTFLRMGLAAAPAIAGMNALTGVARAAGVGPSNLVHGAGKPITTVPNTRWKPSSKAGALPPLPKTAAYAETVSNQILAELGNWMKAACATGGVKYLEATPNGNDALYNQEMRTYISSGKVGGLFMLDNIWAEDIFSAEASIKAGMCQVSLHDAPGTMLISEAIYDQGFVAGQAAAKFIKSAGISQPAIIYEYVANDLSIHLRKSGSLAALKQYGLQRYLVETLDCGEPTSSDAQKALSGALQAHPTTNVVICQNDDVGAGAYAALLAAGKSDPTKYGVFSADGSSQALAIIGSGKPSIWKATAATFVPIMGYGTGLWMVDWFHGRSIPQVTFLTPFLLDSKPVIDKWSKDLNNYVAITHAMRNGDNTYATPLGSISYATRGTYFNGVNTGTVPKNLH
jgi:hypothetical protein